MPKISLQVSFILRHSHLFSVGDNLVDAHDRPINCMAVRGNDVVTGSSDHSLKVIDLQSCEIKRELYSKRYGHKEWVTCVDYVSDGRIISGGMDSKLCLWNRTGVKCVDLFDHKGSISQVQCGENNLCVTSSYDKTLKVWDLDEPKCLYTLRNSKFGHTKAVQRFFWKNSLVVSGGRDSLLCIWDINSAKHISTLEEHSAPIQSIQTLCHQNTNVLVTGGMDSAVCVWDLRTCNLVQSVDVSGSVNDVKISNPLDHPKHSYPQICVGCHDKTIRILDMKKNFKVRTECTGHKEGVNNLCLINDLILSGGDNGWVLVHDMMKGNCLYGVGITEKGACTQIEVIPPKHFVATGDDGNVVVFNY